MSCEQKYANVSSETEEHEKFASIFLLSLVVTELERVKKHIFFRRHTARSQQAHKTGQKISLKFHQQRVKEKVSFSTSSIIEKAESTRREEDRRLQQTLPSIYGKLMD